MAVLVLDSTTKTIKAVMSGAATTTNPDFTAHYGDTNGTTFANGSSDGALNGTSVVTLVSAPSSGYQRAIKYISIENRDTTAKTITVYLDNNGTQRNIAVVTLNVGDTWTTDGTFDTYGSLKQTLGSVNLSSGVTGTLPVGNGGTGLSTTTAYGLIAAGTTATGAFQQVSGTGTSGQVLTSNGAGALPSWQAGGGITTGKAIAMAMIFGF